MCCLLERSCGGSDKGLYVSGPFLRVTPRMEVRSATQGEMLFEKDRQEDAWQGVKIRNAGLENAIRLAAG
jgi:hypothetical protein